MYKWGKTSIKRMKGVNPQLVECATRALARCSHFDQSVQWRGGLRTAEQQAEIFGRGASKKDGYNKKSYHQSGNALDVAPSVISMEDLDKMVKGTMDEHAGFREFAGHMFTTWQEMKEACEADGILVWGGNWRSFQDVPHWQVNL